MLDLDALRALATRYLSAGLSYRLAREALSAADEIERLIAENDALRAECVRTANDLAAVEHERDEAECETGRFRTALLHYCHCPHAIPDCYCTEIARAVLGDAHNG